MAMFKCKMCGGNLEVSNETVAVCEYCNTKQTLPKTNDDVMSNLFNRANNLRLKCEFDKAIQIYEKILEQDDSEAEAHWGIVLCKYGIEYVEDPETSARIPTCHRTLFEAVTTDSDYLAAIDYSDATQQSVYESEARAINRIQKDILKIVENEKPFDVFICYKETDENGKRTVDSTIANDIYYQLTEEGFKVFYSAITLEDKLGEAYEPYIFAALNSAKVMLVLGTKPEYFNAVWVKNEWSRYLQLMKTNRSKLLIPCYRDMDAYDLPEEFSHLQSQDMGKIGFINDVIRGIKKVIQKNETKPETVVKETVVQQIQGNTDTAPLLKRAFMFLEDGDFKSAEEYCEKVLDINPECAEAYLGKLMVDFKIGRKENLKNLDNPFSDNINYQKIMRFGDENLKNEISGYIEEINQRNENARIARIYNDAVGMMRMDTESSYERAIKNFESIYGYKDSIELAKKCREAIAQLCEKQERERLEREAWVRTKKLLAKKIAVIAGIVIIGIVILNIINTNIIVPYNNNLKIYNQAISYMDAGQYEDAMQKFEEVGLDFKDSQDKYEEAIYNQALSSMDAGQYEDAMQKFEEVGLGYKDSQTKYDEAKKKLKEYYQKSIRKSISTGYSTTAGIKSNGTVVSVGNNEDGQRNVSGWTDIVAVSASGFHTVGLKSDGTVVATGYNGNGQCDVSGWTDIVAVSAGNSHTIGLKSDGTVVAVGNNKYGQCDISSWTDIVAVSASEYHTVGLKSDGTVVATGDSGYGQCDVSDWTDIIAISAGGVCTVGLKSDGTVVATRYNEDGECDVSGWTDIVAVSASGYHTVGLKSDGTVVAVGRNDLGQCNVSGWTDIVAVSAGYDYTVGLKSYGSVVAVGSNSDGQCNVSD
ncbi:MAG: TIR domain-containing protein [Oscillospiraceae bacterium]|nr:TIR domain-containing protein [Oscillospiraceae bacterium]